MHSAIYQGFLRHRRFTPKPHKFTYEVFMMYLDLDELEQVLSLSPLWSQQRRRPVQFRRGDYYGDPAVPLKQAVQERIHADTGKRFDGSVRLLANLRYYGYVINPIACYYCFDSEEKLRYILVEVTNTPWNERQSYLLECDPDKRSQRIRFGKEMHVSPFNPMDMTYDWCSNDPAKLLSLNLETWRGAEKHVDATMALKRREISAASLNGILLQHPWMTAKVAGAIYWEALKLWLKRNPFYDHPATEKPGELDDPTITRLKTKT